MILHPKNIADEARSKEAGFTLIEVLISLFIFALISVGTMTALTQSLQGKTRLNQAVDEINKLNSARSILRADMTALTLRPMRDELGGIKPFSLTTDGEALLSFMRRGRENPGGLERRGDLERVEYHLINGDLIRRSFAHENPSSDPQYFDRVLLGNVQDVKIFAHSSRVRGGLSGSASNSQEFFRVPPIGSAPLSPVSNDDQPAALAFEITDSFGVMTAHFFELDL